MTPRSLLVLGCVTLAALPAAAELVSLGDWPVDETRAALQVGDELFRNCGRVLERWDVATDPPVLLDSLVLDSPLVDLLEWDGLLLVQRDDGMLEARNRQELWRTPAWTISLDNCTHDLKRVGNHLLPVTYANPPLIDMSAPLQPLMRSWREWNPAELPFGGSWCASSGPFLCGNVAHAPCGTANNWAFGVRWLTLDSTGVVSGGGSLPPGTFSFISAGASLSSGDLVLAGMNHLITVQPMTWAYQQHNLFSGGQHINQLAARDSLVAASTYDSLWVGTVRMESATPFYCIPTPWIYDLEWTADGLLATHQEGSTWWHPWLESTPMRELPAAGGIRSWTWFGEDMLIRHSPLIRASRTETGFVSVGQFDLESGTRIAGSGDLVLAEVPTGTALLLWPRGQSPTRLSTLPLRARDGLVWTGHQLAALLDDDTLEVWNLSEPTVPRRILRDVRPTSTIDASPSCLARRIAGGIQLYSVWADSVEAAALWPGYISSFCIVDTVLICRMQETLQLVSIRDPNAPVAINEMVLQAQGDCTIQGGAGRLLIHDAQHNPDASQNLHCFDLFAIDPEHGLSHQGHVEEIIPYANVRVELSDQMESQGCFSWQFLGSGLRVMRDQLSLAQAHQPPMQPEQIELAAAPNPFNPVTRLSFTLERPGAARLVVFDLRGREVARPAAGDFSAGTHEIAFDASALASGIYVARLEAEGRTAVAKLALVR